MPAVPYPIIPHSGGDQASAQLRTDHLESTLRTRSVRGVAISVGAQGARTVINVATLAVLARLLTKEDFGMVFAVTAITNVIATFGDLGLPAATIQRSSISQAQVSALFWINVMTSGAVMVVTWALAPLAVWFYGGDHRLLPVFVAFGVIHLVSGLSVQHEAVLRRQMRFAPLAFIDVGSLAGSRAAAIAAAWYGLEHWALVVQSGLVALLGTLGLWLACGWRPNRPARTTGLRPLLAFGGNLATGRLLWQVASNGDKVAVRYFHGAAATGVYGNAHSLLALPVTNLGEPFSSVVIPALSRLQEDPERFRRFYRTALLLLATAGMPLVIFVAVAAERVVDTVLGPQWHETAVIFRVLAPAAFIATFNPATTWAYVALGRTDRQIRWLTMFSLTRIAATLVGVRWGVLGVAAAVSVTTCVLRWPGIAYCFRGTPLELRDLGEALWRPTVASGGAGLAIAAVGVVSDAGSAPLRLLVEAVGFALMYALLWRTLPGGRDAIANVARLSRDLLPRDGADAAPAAGSDVAAVSARALDPGTTVALPSISVIVPVYNDAARLPSCLRALEAQTYPRDRIEILVVDNGSTDQSAAVVADFPHVRLFHEPTPGSYAARNAGLAAATAEVIAFTDSDCIPDPEWLASGVAELRRVEDCGLVGGAVRVLFRSDAKPTTAELYDHVWQFDQARFVSHGRFACTANVFTWARVIADVGPFDSTVKSVGDRDFGNRIAAAGYRLAFAPHAIVSHPARATVLALLRKRRRVAGGHHDRSRKLPHPWLRLLSGLAFHLVRNPIVGSTHIWRRTRQRHLGERMRIVSVHLICCGTEAMERVRLQLGGTSHRA